MLVSPAAENASSEMVAIRHQREESVEDTVCDRVKERLGITSLKLNLRGNNGWPDRLFFIPGGRPFLIEFKREGEEPEPLQAHRHQFLKDLGYDVEVHDDVTRAYLAVRQRLLDYQKGTRR